MTETPASYRLTNTFLRNILRDLGLKLYLLIIHYLQGRYKELQRQVVCNRINGVGLRVKHRQLQWQSISI